MTDDTCHHLLLKKIRIGLTTLYKCCNNKCGKMYQMPEDYVIRVIEHDES